MRSFAPTLEMVRHLRRELGVTEELADDIIEVVFDYLDQGSTESARNDCEAWVAGLGGQLPEWIPPW